MNEKDVDQVKAFIKHFTLNSLLPFVERQIRVLNETVSKEDTLVRVHSFSEMFFYYCYLDG